MSETRLSVFISATSRDLRSYREAVTGVLLDNEIFPITQEHFPPDYRELIEFLRDRIAQSDAVICLAGFVYGDGPQTASPPRSYTQIEYDVARELAKHVYVFLSTEQCVPDDMLPDADENRELQLRHREVLRQNHLCEFFSTIDELRLSVANVTSRLRDTRTSLIFYLHPPTRPSHFAGRVEELSQLRGALRRRTCLIGVIGMGGQGKTTLVHEALRESRGLPFAVGFWCTAYRGGFTFDMFLDEVLKYLLGDRFDKRNVPDLRQRSAKLMELLQQRPILIVIDGIERWLRAWKDGASGPQAAETFEERVGVFDGLDEFLMQASGFASGTHIVFTTRALPAVLDGLACSLVPVREDGSKEISLQGLDPEASLKLLTSLGVKGSAAAITRVAEAYSHHPLALTVLGGLLSKKFGGRLDKLPRVAAMDPKRALYRLFDETREYLPGRAAAERFLIAASHCLENPTLPAVAASLGVSTDETARLDDLLERAITLADWNLIAWDGDAEVVIVHPLVKQYFAALASEAESAASHRRLSDWYSKQLIPADASSLTQMHPRLLAIEHSLCGGDLMRCAELLFSPATATRSLADWLAVFGHLSSGIALLGRLADASTGTARVEMLIARAAMSRQSGALQLALNDLDEAITMLDRVDGSRRIDHLTKLAAALTNRGNVWRQLASYQHSLADYDRAGAALESATQGDASGQFQMVAVLANRGNLFRDMGHLSKAVAECTRAIDLQELLVGPILKYLDPVIAAALVDRGNAYADLRESEAALRDYDAAVRIYQLASDTGNAEFVPDLGKVKVMRGTALHDLYRDVEALGQIDEAIPCFRELVAAGRGEFEATLAHALMNRAMICAGTDRLQDASADSSASVAAYSRLVAAGRADLEGFLAHSHFIRSGVLAESGDWNGSETSFARAVAVAQRLIRSGQTDARIMFVRYLTIAGIRLIAERPEQASRVLTEMLEEVELALASPDPPEALKLEVLRAAGRLDGVSSALTNCGFDTVRIFRLRDLAHIG